MRARILHSKFEKQPCRLSSTRLAAMGPKGRTTPSSKQDGSSAYVLSMLQGLHIEEQPCPARPMPLTKLTDLPQPWLAALVSEHLHSSERYALFQTCKPMAELVVHHSPGITLCPAPVLCTDSSRRAAVMGLAAGSNNIHLHVKHPTFSLDTASVWQGISQLTLSDVPLSNDVFSRLCFRQLSQVHTITLPAPREFHTYHRHNIDCSALSQLLQAGGLPALRKLKVLFDTYETEALQRLGPLLGDRITHLHLHTCDSMQMLSDWRVLQELVVLQSWLGVKESAAACKEIIAHPYLRMLHAPAALFNSIEDLSSNPWALQSLHLTGLISTQVLARLPLRGVHQLQLSGFRLCSDPAAAAAVLNLEKSGARITIVPSTWEEITRVGVSGLNTDTPTIRASFHPQLVRLLQMTAEPVEGALVLTMEGAIHLPAFAQIPKGFQVLCLEGFRPGNGLTWMDIIEQIPPHIECLVLKGGAMNKLELRAAVSQPAPQGLQRLILGDEFYMRWTSQVKEIRELVAEKWPHVQVELYQSLRSLPVAVR